MVNIEEKSPKTGQISMLTLLVATSFAIILVLSVFVSSSFSVLPSISAQPFLPPPVLSENQASTSPNGSPVPDPITGGLINQYFDSQAYPYQEPYQIPFPYTQTLPEESLPLEEQQLLQEKIDVIIPETTINSVMDGNKVPIQEGTTTTSNQVLFTVQGTDDSAVTSFQCAIDSIQQDPLVCSTNPIVAENLQPGVHHFQISSVDLAGNVDATPAAFSWYIVSTSDQSLPNEVIPQLQQFPKLLQDQQQMLPYQPNISPFTMVIPNPSNADNNITTIYENLQPSVPIPSPTSQITNPVEVPPQYYATHPNQLLQSSQNISNTQQPFDTSLQSPSQTFSFSSSQLDSHPQITTKSNNNVTTNDMIGQDQNPLDVQKQLQDAQKGQIQTYIESAGGKQDDTLSSSLENKFGIKPNVITTANSTSANASTTSAANKTGDNTLPRLRTANNSSSIDSANLNSTTSEGITKTTSAALSNNNNSQAAYVRTREHVQGSQLQTAATSGAFKFSSYTITDFVYNPRTGEGLPNYSGNVKACVTPGSQAKDGHEYDTRANPCDPSTTSPPRPFPIVEYNGVMYRDTHINPVPVVTDSTGHVEYTVHTPISTNGGIGIAGEDYNISQYPGAVCNTGCPLLVQNKIEGLSQMSNSANCAGTTTYFFQKQGNHECDFYGTANVNNALARIANNYVSKQRACIDYRIAHPTDPSTDPTVNPCIIKHQTTSSSTSETTYTLQLSGTPKKMKITAMTGPWGGLLDIGPNTGMFWNPPHKTHNDGKNVDIGFDGFRYKEYISPGVYDRTFDHLRLLRYIIKNDPLVQGFGAINEGKDMSVCATQRCDHYHIVFLNTPKPAGLSASTLIINAIPATGAGKTLTISGILKDTTTNAPISGATITFASTTGTTGIPVSTTTAADGTFGTTATTTNTEGPYAARAQFAGDSVYKSTSAAKTYYVDTTKPTVSLTSPTNGATFTTGSPITIAATAADKLLSTSTTNNGKVAKVTFYNKPDTSTTFSPIITDTASPYSTTWTAPTTAGSYHLMARATDAAGNAQNSVSIGITVR